VATIYSNKYTYLRTYNLLTYLRQLRSYMQ